MPMPSNGGEKMSFSADNRGIRPTARNSSGQRNTIPLEMRVQQEEEEQEEAQELLA